MRMWEIIQSITLTLQGMWLAQHGMLGRQDTNGVGLRLLSGPSSRTITTWGFMGMETVIIALVRGPHE